MKRFIASRSSKCFHFLAFLVQEYKHWRRSYCSAKKKHGGALKRLGLLRKRLNLLALLVQRYKC